MFPSSRVLVAPSDPLSLIQPLTQTALKVRKYINSRKVIFTSRAQHTVDSGPDDVITDPFFPHGSPVSHRRASYCHGRVPSWPAAGSGADSRGALPRHRPETRWPAADMRLCRRPAEAISSARPVTADSAVSPVTQRQLAQDSAAPADRSPSSLRAAPRRQCVCPATDRHGGRGPRKLERMSASSEGGGATGRCRHRPRWPPSGTQASHHLWFGPPAILISHGELFEWRLAKTPPSPNPPQETRTRPGVTEPGPAVGTTVWMWCR